MASYITPKHLSRALSGLIHIGLHMYVICAHICVRHGAVRLLGPGQNVLWFPIQYHAIHCITIQYNTIQYHALQYNAKPTHTNSWTHTHTHTWTHKDKHTHKHTHEHAQLSLYLSLFLSLSLTLSLSLEGWAVARLPPKDTKMTHWRIPWRAPCKDPQKEICRIRNQPTKPYKPNPGVFGFENKSPQTLQLCEIERGGNCTDPLKAAEHVPPPVITQISN